MIGAPRPLSSRAGCAGRGSRRLPSASLLARAARERPLVREHQVHAGASASSQQPARIVGGEIDQYRTRERVPAMWRDRLLRRGRAPLSGSAQSRPLLLARQRRESAGARPWGSNTKPLRSMMPATRSAQRRPADAAREEPGERAPDLAEAEQHDLHPLGRTDGAARRCGRAGTRRGCGAAPRRSFASTTTEMLSSRRALRDRHDVDPARARAQRTRAAAMPGMPPCRVRPPRSSPRLARPRRRRSRRARSRPELVRAASRAASAAAASGTLKQIECSDEACEMSETEIRRAAARANVRAAMPGTPSMPFPVTVISACRLTRRAPSPGIAPRDALAIPRCPARPGRAKGRTKKRRSARRASGMRARGCSTLAP